MGQLHLSKACWELWLSDDQPHSDYNGQWQRVLCILAVLQSSQPNPQRKEKKKMYVIKQIKICAEYRDMLPRPRLDLSGTPGLRPIGLSPGSWQTSLGLGSISPGSWQTSLGLGSMSRYSAQILICRTKALLWTWPTKPCIDFLHLRGGVNSTTQYLQTDPLRSPGAGSARALCAFSSVGVNAP